MTNASPVDASDSLSDEPKRQGWADERPGPANEPVGRGNGKPGIHERMFYHPIVLEPMLRRKAWAAVGGGTAWIGGRTHSAWLPYTL